MWIADTLIRAVPHSLGVVPDEWPARWPALLPRLEPFLAAVERHVEMDGYARGVRVAMERAVAAYATAAPMTLGLHRVDGCECTAAIDDRVAPAGCERYAIHVRVHGEPLGIVELPVIDGIVRATVVRDAIAATLAWPLLGRFFDATHLRSCTFHDDGDSCSAWRDGECLATGLPKDPEARRQALHDVAGWDLFVRDLWSSSAGDTNESADEQRRRSAGIRARLGRARGEFASAEMCRWRMDVADVLVTAGGVPVALLRVEGDEEVIAARDLPQRLGDAIGFELCRVAVREALIGRSWEDVPSLRVALQHVAREARAAVEAGREDIAAGGQSADAPSGSDLAAAPTTAPRPSGGHSDPFFAGWRALAERRAGAHAPADNPGAARPALHRRERRPDLRARCRRTGARVAAGAGERNAGPRARTTGDARALPERRVATRRTLSSVAPLASGWDTRAAARDSSRSHSGGTSASRTTSTRRRRHPRRRRRPWTASPILMYHRVAPTGPAPRARWRVTPDAFDEQLAALAEQGYCSIRLGDWQRAMDQGRPLPPRPVLVTFDDGYDDFAEFAWPALQRHGFGALAFIVTGCVGRHNTWDDDAASETLMDWASLRSLRDAGVDFGAHSVTHRRFTVLSPAEAFAEAARSRLQLEDELQLPVDTFAYPYGAEDPVMRHVVGSAGFQFGLSVRSGSAQRYAPWLALPRIEVTNEDSAKSLLAKLDE